MTHAQHAKWICQWSFERLRIEDKEIFLKLQTAATQIDQLITASHDITKSYASDMKIAHVMKSGYKRMFYNTQLCLLDYVVCQLEIRAPKKRDQFNDPLSQDDYLRSIDWASIDWAPDVTEIGMLMYDKYIMKRGRSIGVTYGIVGVYSVMRYSNIGVMREFWVLSEDKSTILWQFSKKGDSGVLVWTFDGKTVGIIIAKWTVMFDKP